MSKLGDKLRSAGAAITKPRESLWKGPEDSGPQGGITQSMMNLLLACPERARLRLIEGWQTPPRFNHKMDYGTIWHAAEEHYARTESIERSYAAMLTECQKFRKMYPFQQEEILHWLQTCQTQFPLYVDYWRNHRDVIKRQPLLEEYIFSVPYELPSGRSVYLRGKLDSVDLVDAKLWLQENKTKGDFSADQLSHQLTFDLQTMTYIVAINEMQQQGGFTEVSITNKKMSETKIPIAGVRYNVIRRPFSGGRGSIRKSEGTKGAKCTKCKGIGTVQSSPDCPRCPKCDGAGRTGGKPPETDAEFQGRLSSIIKEDSFEGSKPKPDSPWFLRLNVDITSDDIFQFKRQFLTPFLENVCNLYNWWSYAYAEKIDHFDTQAQNDLFWDTADQQPPFHHYRKPYGIYDPMVDGGGATDLDEYIRTGRTGSAVGLVQVKSLFNELEES